MKTNLQILYDTGLLIRYDNVEESSKEYLLIEVNERRRADLNRISDDIIQGFYS